MTFKLIKEYIDKKRQEPHSGVYLDALDDINRYIHELESRNACAYCGKLDTQYPHYCKITSPRAVGGPDNHTSKPFQYCHE